MRIDFSWGSDRQRVEHVPAQLAEIVLSPFVSAQSFGPALQWLDVLCLTAPGKKPLKEQWRWRGSRSQHLIVDVPAPAQDDAPLDEAVYRIVALAAQALARVKKHLDRTLGFDIAAALAAVEQCLAQRRGAPELAKLLSNPMPHHEARFADMQFGFEAARRAWRRPLTRPLQWVRVHAVGDKRRAGGMLASECAMVGALLGSALYQRIDTPGYVEIYVNVGSDAQAVRLHRTALEEWSENAYAVVAEKDLVVAQPPALRRVLFDAARKGLLELAAIDRLDAEEIARQLDRIDVEGLTTEFVYRCVENPVHVAELVYAMHDRADRGAILQPHFHLRVTRRKDGQARQAKLGAFDLWDTKKSFGKLALGAKAATLVVRRDGRTATIRLPLP